VTDRCRLVLRTSRWFCGEAWLGYRVLAGDGAGAGAGGDGARGGIGDGGPRVEQVGALRSKGLLGLVYWRLVWPIHVVVFEVMAKQQASVKMEAAAP